MATPIPMPAHCKVNGVMNERTGVDGKPYAIGFELRMPVNLHVTDPTAGEYPGRVETPLEHFVQLATDHPQVKFILAHWGGGLAFDSGNSALPNVYFDTAASPLLYGAEVWAKAPAGRVLFGSDYPLVLYPQTGTAPEFVGIVREAQAAGADEALLGGTAADLLGLKQP